MDSKEIESYKQILMAKCRIIEENAKYSFGDNPGIFREKAVPKPDNRIPIPLGKSAVTDVVGYAGRAGDVKTEYFRLNSDGEIPEDGTDKDEITAYIEEMDKYNHEDIENSELMYASLSLGLAWELWWVSDELETAGSPMTAEYKILDNRECIAVWDGSLKPKLEKFLRFWCKKEDGEDKEYLDVYYPKLSEQYRKEKDSWIRNEKGDSLYPFNRVPVIPFRTSMGDQPLFEAQKPIIDAFDKLVSQTQNEVDRYNALITLFPGGVTKDFIEKLTELAKPYIDNLDDYDPAKWPKYLEKNLSGVDAFYQAQADRLERLFHKTIKVPDMSDKEFAGNQSGVAIAYKLIGFEFLVAEIEIYFRQGLEKRKDFYFDIIRATKPDIDPAGYEQRITMNRNIPVDAEAKVRIAAMLQGLGYPKEAIDRYMPDSIIKDSLVPAEEEIEDGKGIIDLSGTTVTDPLEAVKLSGIQISAANEIINQVATGAITREAGINQLVVFLGLTEEQANKVMGRQ